MKETFTNNIEETLDNLYIGGAFFTVGDNSKVNTMTISWGSIGYMWRRPMFMAMIRDSRYSYEFLELGKTYTISIPFNKNKKEALDICGRYSGRNVNKKELANIKYIPSKIVKTPIVEGCEKYYECRIVLKQKIDFDNINDDIKKKFYSNNDGEHILFFGEILAEY